MRLKLGLDNVSPLPRAIIMGWQQGSPVDCLVISPDLKLLGRQPVNEIPATAAAGIDAYNGFLTSSLAGDQPGLGPGSGKAAAMKMKSLDIGVETGKAVGSPMDSREVRRMLEGLGSIAIELVGPGNIKINGKGPLTTKKARAEVVDVALKKGGVVVMLRKGPRVSDAAYKAFTDSLRDEGGILEGIDVQAMSTVMRHAKQSPSGGGHSLDATPEL